MIHNFKNLILRQDRKYILKASLDILNITALLTSYQNIGLSVREKAAMDILDSRLTKYEKAIAVAEKMAGEGRTSKEIDAVVHVNDDLAISAMLAIVGELEQAYADEGSRVEQLVAETNRTSNTVFIASLVLAFGSIGFTLWFMYLRVLAPIRVLSESMQEISRRNTSEPVPGTMRDDEIGDMARTVEVFRNVIVERKSFEASLIESRELAESSNRAKTDFLANMSHELRTPLNGIIGLSEVIREGTFGPLENDKYAEYINEIHDSGSHLLAVVQNILDVSEIDSSSVALKEESVNLGSVIQDCLRELAQNAEARNISLRNHADPSGPMVHADPGRITQIFNNVLTNAVKFTPDGGDVSIDSFFEEGGTLAISITDTGIGMARDAINEALSPFGQVNRGHFAKHEGTGLGLYLTRILVEMHGGVLKVKSAVDRGTRVTVILPKERIIDSE